MHDLHLSSCHAAGGQNMTRTGDQRTRLRQTTSCHRIGLSYSTRLWTLENTASRCVTIPALDTGTVHFYPSVPTDPDFASRPPESELNGCIPLLDDRSFGHTNTCVIVAVRRARHPCSQSVWKKMLQRLLKPRQFSIAALTMDVRA